MQTLVLSTIATLGVTYYLKFGTLFAGFTWPAVYLLLSTLVPFTWNIFSARRTGFPSVYIPWQPHSFAWMILQMPLSPVLKRWLPSVLWQRINITVAGWEFHLRNDPFDRYAAPQGNRKSFVSVCFNPHLELNTWDSEIISQVLGRPNDFQVEEFTKLFMDRFGRNVLTSNGDAWHRQRKVVASAINEKISKAIFNETIQQTQGLLHEVFNQDHANISSADTNKLFDMMKKITMKVLSGAGLGTSAPWDDTTGEEVRPGYQMNYMEACKTVTEAVAGPIILPQWFLDSYPSSWPGAEFLRKLGYAVREFPDHTKFALEEERKRNEMSKSGEARGNIMSQMLRALDGTSSAKGPAMHEDELTGNLFIFTVAGFDTTANTLSYTLMMLARHPEWQDWLFEEIDSLLPEGKLSAAELEYIEIHPKATRTLALMYEMLRLFPPVVQIAKQTKGEQIIETSGGTYWLPDHTRVYMSAVGAHLDSEVYRNININTIDGEKPSDDDELKFRPSRWINAASAKTTHFQPPKGAFIPWSSGPRSCPGMKMAQVEFVAVMLMLLRHHRVEAVPLPGEDRAAVERRLEAQIQNSISKLTLEMVGVYDVADSEQGFKLRLSKRNA